MDFIGYWQSIQAELDRGFAQWMPDLARELSATHQASIQQAVTGGKRLRGCLVCLTAEALGGRRAAAIPRAVAIECIQAASLIHDDYVDGDTLRRQRPAIWTVEGARRAVLLGDLIFATAIWQMAELGREDGATLARAIATVARGAYREALGPAELAAAVAGRDFPPDLYKRIIHLKTGALFGAAAKLGALAAATPPALADQAFEFGARLGEAYQLADDLLDLFDAGSLPEDPRDRLALWAPALLCFLPEKRATLLRLLQSNGNGVQAWLDGRLPVLRARMMREVERQVQLAASTLAGFPDNGWTRLLQAAPAQVVALLPQPAPARPAISER